ncbi:MAG: hypothetical protein AMK73_05905 [Planctomycetes bacterium SM23_32]|nr:MAG: hypothetical protein AMK73_05905 [Planctomycetes bacterium SM23_32]
MAQDESAELRYEVRRQARGAEPIATRSPWRRRLLVGGLVVLTLGLAVGGVFIWYAVMTVRTVSAYVRADMRKVESKVEARIEELLVEVGDHVEPDQVVARLDDEDQRSALEDVKSNLRIAEDLLAQTMVNRDLIEASVDSAIEAADARVEAAAARQRETEAHLASVLKGSREEDIQAAEHRLNAARALRELYALEVRQSEELVVEGIDSRYILEQRKTRLATQEEAVAEAQVALQKLKAGATEEEIQAARQAVATRKAELAEAQAELSRVRTRKMETILADKRIQEAQSRVQAEKERVRQAEEALARRQLRSPCRGIVTRVFEDEGEVCAKDSALMFVQNEAKPLSIYGHVREKDAAYVQPGQPARVEILPTGEVIEAEVERTGLYTASVEADGGETVASPAGRPELVWVKLRLTAPAKEPLLPGNRARAVIRVR